MLTVLPEGSDIFASGAEVLVNPVNCVGVMGKGLAAQFKGKFPPAYFSDYQAKCKRKELRPGGITRWLNPDGSPRYIINLATKDDWRNPSRYEWIEAGAKALREWAERTGIKTLGIAPLGAGEGGLDANRVESILRAEFENSSVNILWHPQRGQYLQSEKGRAVAPVQQSFLQDRSYQVLSKRLEVERRVSLVPSIAAIAVDRNDQEVVPSDTPIKIFDIALNIDNATKYRGTGKSLDTENSFYVGRVSWPGKELGVARYWGLRNQFKVLSGAQAGKAIGNFEKSLRASLLGDQATLDALAVEDPGFDANSGPEIVRDFYRAVDRAEKTGKMMLLCHCHPNACHTEIIGLYMAAELQRRGKSVSLYPQALNNSDLPDPTRDRLDSMRNRVPEILELLVQSKARSVTRSR